MFINLVDLNKELTEYWWLMFSDVPNVRVYHDNFFNIKCDCLVSPANSFGFMDGGIDKAISYNIGNDIINKVQNIIKNKYYGEILVGQAELVESGNIDYPYLIVAPTMRVPCDIRNTMNVYLCASAIFKLLKRLGDNTDIKSVNISGLGTLTGQIEPNVCAKQMRIAYRDVFEIEDNFPLSLQQSYNYEQEIRTTY